VCAKVKPVAFHRHFTAISPFCLLPFDDAPKIAVKQKASGTWKVQSAGCTEFGAWGSGFEVQSAELRVKSAKKTRRLRGLGSQLETACLFARWHAA